MNETYHYFMHNNIDDDTQLLNNIDTIIDTLHKGNNELLKHINNKVLTDNEQRLVLINKILNSNYTINYNLPDIKKFFTLLTPLNIEYNLGDKSWCFKEYDDYLLIQNCALKINLSQLFYDIYINKIVNILNISNIKFYYKEFKDRRNYKTKDLIFIVKIKNI